MSYQNFVISLVEALFPTGTKRREMINIVGRPVALALGFPIPKPEKNVVVVVDPGDFDKLVERAREINRNDGNIYWDSIVNLLRLKTSVFLSDPGSRMVFPYFEKPVVSILLVTFNKVEYTFQCLESIKANTDVPYEVIIVDNASSDMTPDFLDRLDNVTVIKNEDNLGFLLACNQGAKSACGEHIMFLNNDTQVCPGWMSSLVRIMEEYPKCGAVGGKLIMPDGHLQEGGSILWRNGSAFGYGRKANPSSPEYNYVKEVDFCSGACLLVRKSLLTEFGGFDERYVPAYYEEADLCYNIRRSGYKVVYQPEAAVIHYEFGSGSLKKATELSLVNRKKFVEKWGEALMEDNFPFSDENVIRARDRRTGPRVLVVDDRIPAPYLGSGYPRAYELLCDLARLGYVVTFVPHLFPDLLQPHTKYLQQMGVEVFYADARVDFERFIAGRRGYYDTAIISRPQNMVKVIDPIRKHSPGTPVIYDAEAIFALRDILRSEVKGKRLSEEKRKRLISEELKLFKQADVLLAVSEYEKKVFAEYGFPKVEVWGHPVRPRITKTCFDDRKDILFVGSFLLPDSPNEDAVLYFAEEIFPKIRPELDCRLWVVGTNHLDSVKALESNHIRVTGRVDDLMKYFERCRLFVVPHRFASGIPLKLLEAMGFGLPAVVSPLMAKQLGLADGGEVLVGSSPDEFAEKVGRLYTDGKLWTDLREASVNFVKKTCDAEKMRKDLDEIVKHTLNQNVSQDKVSKSPKAV